MAYVPQFIPTNTQVLQSTLDQYQKAYDTETARMNQVSDMYSSIPTTNPYDTAEKNKVMNEFKTKVIDELDKKYNYDRANSQYAKELSREITNLRANPLWSLVEQRGKVDDMRQKLMQERGANYYENFDPNSKTSIADLKNWQSKDLRTLEAEMVGMAGQKAKSYIKTRYNRDPNYPGYIFKKEQVGYKDAEESANFLNNDEGKAWLRQSIIDAGWNPDDPAVYGRAYNAAISNLVGTTRTDEMQDSNYIGSLSGKGSGSESDTNKPIPVSNDPVRVGEYSATDLTGLQSINKELANIDKQMSTASGDSLIELQRNRNKIELERDKINSILEEVKSQNPQIIEQSKRIVSEPFLGVKAVSKGDTVKMGLSSEEIDKIEDMVSKYFYTITGTQKLGNTAKREHEIVKEIYRTLKGKELPKPDDQTGEDRDIANDARNMIEEYRHFYKGVDTDKGHYKDNGYREKIVEPTEKMLKDGVQLQYSVSHPGDIKSARYNEVKKFSVDNMKHMLPVEKQYREGKGIEWDQNKLAVVNNIMNDQETTINYLFNTEGDALIRLWNPKGEDGTPIKGGTTVTLRVDPKRSDDTNGIMSFYYNDTGDSRFLSQAFSAIDLAPNKKYNINDKSGYLKSAILDTNMFTPEELNILKNNNISLTRVKDNGTFYYKVEGLTPEPTIVDNKMTLMTALKQYVSQK